MKAFIKYELKDVYNICRRNQVKNGFDWSLRNNIHLYHMIVTVPVSLEISYLINNLHLHEYERCTDRCKQLPSRAKRMVMREAETMKD